MKDECRYVVDRGFAYPGEDDGAVFMGTLKEIQQWLEANELFMSGVSVYRLGPKVNLVLAVEEEE